MKLLDMSVTQALLPSKALVIHEMRREIGFCLLGSMPGMISVQKYGVLLRIRLKIEANKSDLDVLHALAMCRPLSYVSACKSILYRQDTVTDDGLRTVVTS